MGISVINYAASATDTTPNSNLNQSFTFAMQGLLTGNNYRQTVFKNNLGLPVENNSVVQRLSLPSNSSVTLTAGQFIYIMSDTEIYATINPDATVEAPAASGSAVLFGNFFAFTGSYLNTGITLFNPLNVLTPNVATIQVALVT